MSQRNQDPEESEILTGEEVSLDSSAEVTDADLVGNVSTATETVVDEAPGTAFPEVIDSVDETVSLPVEVGDLQTIDEPLPPVDVLQGRADDTESTHITRRSLLTGSNETDSSYTEPTFTEATVVPVEETTVAPASGYTYDPTSSADNMVLADATVLPTIRSKSGTRWLTSVLTVLLTPVAWYLLSDAGARLAFAPGNPWETSVINPAALIELGIGLLVVALIAFLAAQSSLGLLISGVVMFVVGSIFLISPVLAQQLVDDNLTGIRNLNAFGGNVVGCFELTGFSGLLTVAGFFMAALAVALAYVRRAGRREEATRALVAATNPEGLKAHWARKATNKSK
ncbi:hypothetical protein U6G28_04040 [Actinomycetaceae bacterium MB13-C1-2]|nr:hypothetical protein U6G28_04040 [Actinomycetaceae bacterium MB13-C1-2]